MPAGPRASTRYFRLLQLPVLLIVALSAAINLLSFHSLSDSQRTADVQHERDSAAIRAASRFNSDLDDVQVQVAKTLDDAAGGRLDAGEADRIHAGLVDKLTGMDGELRVLEGFVDHGDADLSRFDGYRNQVIMATDLAAADPPRARAFANEATTIYANLSRHAHAVVEAIVDSSGERRARQSERLHDQATWLMITGAGLNLGLVVMWVIVTRWMIRRVRVLSGVLVDLADGNTHPAEFDRVRAIARDEHGMLRDLGRAVLTFRQSLVSRRQAEAELGERMKELSCLYEIFRITERNDIDLPDMFQAVATVLPVAMRYPERATGQVVYGGVLFGERADGERLSADFADADGNGGSVAIVYHAPLPEEAGAPFLDEEVALVQAVALRLQTAVKRLYAEAKEHDQQALINAVVEFSPVAIEVVDPHSLKFLKVNDSACRQLGYGKEELLALDLTAIQDTMSRDELERNARIALRTGGLQFENRHRRKDGSAIDVRINVTSFRQGERDYLLALWEDISQAKASREEIRKLSLVVEQSPNLVVITDLSGQITYVNDAFTRATGYDRAYAIGRNPRFLKSGKTPRATYEAMWDALTRGEAWSGEFINFTRDGREESEAATIVPLRNDAGEVTHYVAVKEIITERKRQEEALRKLALAVNQSPESIVITDLAANIEYVNDAFCRNTGYSREEVIGKNPRVLQSGRTDPTAYREMWTKLTGGDAWIGELVNRRKDGSEYVELAHIAPVRQPGGAVTHYLAIKEDITEKKRMAEELDRHRHHLEHLVAERTAKLLAANQEQEAIFGAVSVGIALIRDRRIRSCNHRMEELFASPPGGLDGQPTRVWYEDEVAWKTAGDEIYPELRRGETNVRTERYVRQDGSRFWARIHARAIDPADPERGLVAIIEDITSEREAAEALRVSVAEQEAIFDSATSGIVLIKDRILRQGNLRLHEMFGWPPGEMIGKPTRIWYADEDAWRIGGEGYEQIWRGETHRREQRLMRRDGSLFWARLNARAVDPHDPSRGSVWVIDDITAERRAIEEMARARALAEDAARAKSDFLANMSHEIRTPMNAIIGTTHLLRRAVSDPGQARKLDNIAAAARHLLNLINDILDLSKIEAGKLTINPADFDVEQVVENALVMIAEKAQAKNIEIVLDIGTLPTHLHGDGLRLGQVLLNFTSNAVKFTTTGSIILRGRILDDRTGDRLWTRFEVSDTGIGLTDDQRGRLFLPFEQADRSISRKYGGTGLGLAISKRLTELMGGRIGVDSHPGHGSTFWIEVPLETARSEAAGPVQVIAGGLRALVVDDLEEARHATAATLRQFGLTVEEAADGEQALGLVARAAAGGMPFDVVLMDDGTLGRDGAALVQRLKRQTLPHPPVCLLMRGNRPAFDEGVAPAGIAATVVKPVVPSRLFDALQNVLAGGKAIVAGRSSGEAEEALRQRRGGRVLVVEDNAINQEVARELLESVGLAVDVVGNGEQAVAMSGEGRYDLILMDMQMPVMDGLTATRRIRARPDGRTIPIVAMTANAFDADRDACLSAGMNDHVAKPVDPERLYRTLLRWLPDEAGPGEPSADRKAAGRAAPLPAQLRAVDGLDVAAGLRSTAGRADLYERLLRRFADDAGAAALVDALGADDSARARLLAHSIKGMAATLGAMPLSARAAEIESAVDRPAAAGSLRPMAVSLARDCERLQEAIRRALPADGRKPEGKVSADEVGGILRHLEALLIESNVAAINYGHDHHDALVAGLGASADAVLRHIDDFAFDEALNALRAAAPPASLASADLHRVD